MIWLILLIVVFMVVTFCRVDDDFGFKVLISLMMGLLTTLLSVGLAFAINPITHFVQISSHTSQLVNIQQLSGERGSFFLGSGYVDGEQEFSFYVKNPNGTYYLQTADAAGTTIHYTTGTPYVVHKRYGSSHFWWLSPIKSLEGEYSYDIYIPQGSIEQNFTLGGP